MENKVIAFGKELHVGERRTMITPADVSTYCKDGFQVLVEDGAGEGSFFANSEYADAGAEIVDQPTIWRSRYVVKYKAPIPKEYGYFHSNLNLATSFHSEGQEDLILALCKNRVTAYSTEYFVTEDIIRPITFTDMEITGKMAFFFGAYHLQTHFGGSGVLLAEMPGTPRPKVLVIGHGNVGGAAARAAVAAGCNVTVLGRNQPRLRRFAASMPSTVKCRMNTPETLTAEIKLADLVIGAILISTEDTPPMIDFHHLRMMKKGSMIMDITCGIGSGKGWMPTFDRMTTHQDPVYLVDGILHCKIDRIPSQVPVTASLSKSANVAPYLIDLGNAIYSGVPCALTETGKLTENGKLMQPHIAATIPGIEEKLNTLRLSFELAQ